MRIHQLALCMFACAHATLAIAAAPSPSVYDARTEGRQILTPAAPAAPRITGADIFGVRPGKPILFRVSATGEKPLAFSAKGLPDGVTIDATSGWITGRAPQTMGDITVEIEARNAKGAATRNLTLRVGETICLTPPMGWNSWYVHSEGVSDKAIREIATAMQEKGLADHGWSYLNIDDCWMGLRDPRTKAIQPNAKFPDMKALAQFVNAKGFKLGIYSTAWMSTYAGYIGGSSPNEEGDYSGFFLPEKERLNPHQVFGRYPNGIRKGLGTIGPVWFVDRDARQFAEWGIDYVKYDWKEGPIIKGEKGYEPDRTKPERKTEAATKRLHDNFRALDRDIIISLSPDHDPVEDSFVPAYCNLWRLTTDIHAEWGRVIAPFGMEQRLRLTGPGHYGDLDMLQIGPLGKPNRAEVIFKPSPLKPAEQYFQVTLWAILTQPLLLSCHIPTMDAFDLNLVTNDEVLAVNQDRLCKQGYRVANREGSWEIWAKHLADGSKAVAMFNLADEDQTLAFTAQQLGITGKIRDLWRQKDIGTLENNFSAQVTSHGVVFLKITPIKNGGYLFVTFRDERGAMGEQIYFALSKDGVRWTALNNGEPALVSQLGDKGARDPYLIRAEDGKKFFLIATDLSIFHTRNWKRAVQEGSRSLLVWESDDLAHWSAPRLVTVAPSDAGCTWAPEAIYDTASKRYLVYWASTTKRDNFEQHRIWAAWTTDFRAFSEPFIYIEKPTTIIDTDIVHGDDGKYYRFTKDEKFKAITMEVSDGGVTGNWSDVPGFSLAQLRGYEGPACYQLAPAHNGKPASWCLLLDAYATRGGYKPFVTENLASGKFTPGDDFVFPFRFRHGSVLPISADEYKRMESVFSKNAAPEKSFRQSALDALQTTRNEPAKIERLGGVLFVDFGKAAYANLQIEFADAPPAGEITVRLGEKLVANASAIDRKPPGSVNFCEVKLQTHPDKRAYALAIPLKRFHQRPEAVKMPERIGNVTPFRYVEIESATSELAALAPEKITLRQLAAHAPFDEYAATFECSDSALNSIWSLCKYTMKATTAFGVYIDGERERIPYEADAYINQLSHYACDLDPSVARATFEHLLAQPTWPTEWSLQMPMIALADYEATGDPVLAARHYDALKKKLFLDKTRDDGLLRAAAIVDWPAAERDGYNDGAIDTDDKRHIGPKINTVANAFFHEALRSMAQLAQAIGRHDEAAAMNARAEKVRQSFNAVFFDAARGVYTDGEGSQHASLHANMFPLAFGLAPAERRASVVRFVKSRGMACSVYGAQFLLDALYRNNESDTALALMTAKTKRSWWHMLELGSTMTLEAWDAEFKPNLTWNHAWGAAPANIVARYLLGVRPLQPGYAKILIAPQPASLAWMRGKVPTPHGQVEVSWKTENASSDTSALLRISVPQATSARVELPVAANNLSALLLDGAPVTAKIENNKPIIESLAAGSHELKLTLAPKK